MFRWLPVLLIALFPLGVFADDGGALGPQSIAPATTGPASTDSSSLLQPASPNDSAASQPVDGASGGTGQSAAQQTLQQPASQDQAKLFIQGDVDTSESSSGGGLPVGLKLVLGLLIGVVATAYLMNRYERRRSARTSVRVPRPAVVVPEIQTEVAQEAGATPLLAPRQRSKKKKGSKKRRSQR
jgi:hypothetical protein